MIQAKNISDCISQRKCKRATASSASSRNLSLPILSTFAAAAFAVVFLAGAFMAMPARAQSSSGSFSTVHEFDYNAGGGKYGAANPDGNLVEDSNGNLFGVTEYGGPTTDVQCYSSDNVGCGTIYELVKASGYSEQVLYDFGRASGASSDGLFPMGGLTIDSNGNLFGTASSGGTFGFSGTIFELPYDSGTSSYDLPLETLYSFQGCYAIDSGDSTNDLPSGCIEADGLIPTGQLVVDSSGNVFGTTTSGGNVGGCGTDTYDPGTHNYTCGTVFELPSDSGAYDLGVTILHSFTGNESSTPYDSEFPEGGLVADSSGNLFGTSGGYPDGNGAIFELSGSGYSFSVLYTFSSTAGEPVGPVGGLTVDGSGNLFGTTIAGGANSNGVIFELANNGTLSSPDYSAGATTLYSFAGDGSEGNWPLTSLVIDGSGNLYGTTAYEGSSTSTACTSNYGCGAVFELPYDSSGGSYASSLTIIHQFTAGDDGANPALGGLLMDSSSGNIFGTAMGGGNTDCQFTNGDYFLDAFGDTAVPGCGTVFEFTGAAQSALTFGYANLRIIESGSLRKSGFQLQADVTLDGEFDPATQPVTLTLTPPSGGSYTVTIPAGSFQVLQHGHNAGALVFSGTIGGVTLSVQIDPLDATGEYEFKANASGVQLPPDLTSIDVFIQMGDNAGTITVTPSY